ncbi:RNA polymerase subunit sigma-70 [Streptomyces sp. NPDC053493]|uniref:RNA polymerase subunit sigma-70 n=1 Tax=Streptomyces sp. NPDC053493 TaxID=3365705 RepID=UPI0037CE8A8C
MHEDMQPDARQDTRQDTPENVREDAREEDLREDAFAGARFDAHEERLRAVAGRMLGDARDVDAVLAEARAAATAESGLREWLVSVVGRVCVRRLQGRTAGDAPAPPVPYATEVDPVGLALLVVLESMAPGERLAYVLHDLFGLSLGDTGRITGVGPEEADRLARSARRRIRGGRAVRPGAGPVRQRAVVEAFLAAARARDPRALAALLHPEVVARSAHGRAHGPAAVAEGVAAAVARMTGPTRPALVNGAVGIVAFAGGRPVTAATFGVREGRIAALDVVTGEDRVRALDLVFPEY